MRERREVLDRRELESLGRMLDRPGLVGCGEAGVERLAWLGGRGVAEFLAESLLQVRGKDGKLRVLKANGAQREFERRRGLGNIVLKARQMGMTTWVAGRFLLKTITRPGTLTLQVAHTQESAEEILGIVHRFVVHLPAGLRLGVLKTSKSNVRQLVFPEIDSQYRVESAADRNAGRGLTFQNLHCSEVSRWPGNANEVLAGLRAGLAPGGEQVLESTPNGAEGCFYEEWWKGGETPGAEDGLVRHFFPWWMEAGYRGAPVTEASLTDEERALMAGPVEGLSAGLDLEQIGFRRGIRASQGGLARQEFAEDAEECFVVSGEPYFDLEAVERLLRLVTPPLWVKQNGRLEIWLPSLAGRRYVVAVDPAGGGVEGDFSAIEVLDIETGAQCAEYAGHVSGPELMELARQIAWDFNTACLVVERNNHGSGLLWALADKGYREIYRGTDGEPGFLTTSVSRPQVLARMDAALRDSPAIFSSRKLLVECRSFVRLRNGSVGARSGAHDDRVMAFAIGLAARAELIAKAASSY